MPNLRQNPPAGDSPRESLLVTIILRTGLILISSFIFVLLFIVGYGLTSYIFGKTELFDEYPSEYLILAVVCGIGLGLFVPFESIGNIFERSIDLLAARRQGAWWRALLFLLACVLFIILYWYFLTIIVAIVSTVVESL